MIFSSSTKKPKIHSTAHVAPTATISGDVTIGPGCAILHGAVVTAEGAPISIGAETIVMENAVVKSSGGSALQHPVTIGDRCIIGPHAFVSGATLANGVYVSSGARVYNGVKLGPNTHLAPNEVRNPDGDFFEAVFNIESTPGACARAAEAYSKFLRKTHAQDSQLDAHANQAPQRRRAGEEPPMQQNADVEGVVDAMMLELQEMELRRQEALKKKPKR
jgi:carbonic anhydrase/acetyltransferase-like protein (isoleucine patch superfamily)